MGLQPGKLIHDLIFFKLAKDLAYAAEVVPRVGPDDRIVRIEGVKPVCLILLDEAFVVDKEDPDLAGKDAVSRPDKHHVTVIKAGLHAAAGNGDNLVCLLGEPVLYNMNLAAGGIVKGGAETCGNAKIVSEKGNNGGGRGGLLLCPALAYRFHLPQDDILIAGVEGEES